MLQERTYGNLWQTVLSKINEMNVGKTFTLRDLVDTPPANMGVKLFQNQEELGITFVKKDNISNIFVKGKLEDLKKEKRP